MDTILSWLPFIGMTYWSLGVLYWIFLFDPDPFNPSFFSYKEVIVYALLFTVGAVIVVTIWPVLAYQQIKERTNSTH